MHLIKKYDEKIKEIPKKIFWKMISRNESAIDFIEKNLDKVDWDFLTLNKNAIHLLCPLNHQKMKEQCKPFYEELVAYVFNPSRVIKMANVFNLDLDDYLELI